ncbi:MAG: segregation/condensation protein A [Candidatus Dadabacteria bacterium]|nr:segregation/condensation protein A [Candidatus Dadabacteria bacterium]
MTKQQTLAPPPEERFYTVDIDEFEGPLELLLSLVKKREVDIYDIPIAEISDQYHRRLELMEDRSLDVVARYLPFLAELGLIKSRMLLPRPEEEKEEEGVDPRMELARRLIVYERFRDVAVRMGEMSLLGRDVFARGATYADEFGEPEVETELVASGIWPLVVALCGMRARVNAGDTEDIELHIDPVTVEQRVAEIRAALKQKGSVEDFSMLFDEKPSRSQVAVSFMAILELARNRVIELIQKRPFSSIKLFYVEGRENGKDPDKENS